MSVTSIAYRKGNIATAIRTGLQRGRVVAFDDGLLIVADRVEVISKIEEMIEDHRKSIFCDLGGLILYYSVIRL